MNEIIYLHTVITITLLPFIIIYYHLLPFITIYYHLLPFITIELSALGGK